jgi:hypothetical protein
MDIIYRRKEGACGETLVSRISNQSQLKIVDDNDVIVGDVDDEKYVVKTNVCRRLSKILEVPPFNYDEKFHWEPPTEHGLSNCEYIIPSYYKKHNNNNILHMDYYDIIKDDIRNYRPLNTYQMEYILGIQDEYKNELLILFNKCINAISDLHP